MGRFLHCGRIAWCLAPVVLAGCSGDQLHLGGSDGGSRCVPGPYLGTYDCNMGADASSFVPAMSGAIFFWLQGEPGGATLAIRSGAQLTGTQLDAGLGIPSFSFVADLSGTVDCATYKLTGQVSNISFNSPGVVFMVLQNGDLSADYDSTAGAPALVNGQLSSPASLIGGSTPFFPTSPGTNYCSWQAALHP